MMRQRALTKLQGSSQLEPKRRHTKVDPSFVVDFMDGGGFQPPDFEGITHERDVHPPRTFGIDFLYAIRPPQPLCRWLWRLQYLRVDSCIDQRPWSVTGLALDYRLVLRVRSEAASNCWNGHGAIASHELMSYHRTYPTLVMYSTSISPSP
jgi:hypothetical protein